MWNIPHPNCWCKISFYFFVFRWLWIASCDENNSILTFCNTYRHPSRAIRWQWCSIGKLWKKVGVSLFNCKKLNVIKFRQSGSGNDTQDDWYGVLGRGSTYNTFTTIGLGAVTISRTHAIIDHSILKEKMVELDKSTCHE